MTEDEKDEIDLLADAEEDTTPLWIAKVTIGNLAQAKKIIRQMLDKQWICLKWVESWSSQIAMELTGKLFHSALLDIEKDRWWFPQGDVTKGFYAFFITEKGLARYQQDPEVAEYMKNEWRSRAKSRGHT